MKDTIYREDAIEVIKGNSFAPGVDYMEINGYGAIEDIRALPSADRPQGEWIPCSKQLPEEGQTVLIQMRLASHRHPWEEQRCIEFGRISSDRYDAGGTGWEWLNESATDFWEADFNDSVIAWMPLPEPWKGADDE